MLWAVDNFRVRVVGWWWSFWLNRRAYRSTWLPDWSGCGARRGGGWFWARLGWAGVQNARWGIGGCPDCSYWTLWVVVGCDPGRLAGDVGGMMGDVLTVDVWQPPVGRPAGEDFAVALRLGASARMRPLLIRSIVVVAALAVFDFVVVRTMVGLGVVLILTFVAQVARLVFYEVRYGRYLTVVRSITETSVPVRVKVAYVGKNVLSVDDGRMFLRLRATWGVRQVIARTGGLWLAEPRGDMTVVFVDGLPMAIRAEVVARPEPSEVESVGADVTFWATRVHARAQWISLAAFTILFAGLLVDIAQDSSWWWVAGIMFVCLLGGLAVKLLDIFLMPRRYRRGQWQAYPVDVRDWPGNIRMVGTLVPHVTLPDGSTRSVRVRLATSVLAANIQVTGRLWIKGEVEPGRHVVVGVPGWPVAAAGRVS